MLSTSTTTGARTLLAGNRLLLAVLCLSLVTLLPQVDAPTIVAPGARVALETSRFLVVAVAAGLMTGFAGTTRRGFVAALVVLGLTDLWFGVVPNLGDPAAATGGRTLLPWIVARYLAGLLFVVTGLEWPRWSTGRLVTVSLLVIVAVEVATGLTDAADLPFTIGEAGVVAPSVGLAVVEAVPMVLFAVGAVLASAQHARGLQPMDRWLASALLVSAFTQVHQAASPAGLGPVITSADLLRLAATALLLVGAVQQVVQLRRDRQHALALARADLLELRAVTERLRDYVDREAAFRSVVSHELSTPVATISAWSHVLTAGDLPEGAARAGRTIESEARRLRLLLDRLDELAEDVDADALAVEPRPVSAPPLLQEAATFGRALPGGHRVSAHAEEAVILADPIRISQALRNLVGNAAVHSSPGTSVMLTGQVADDRTYRILVSDEGPGFGTVDAEPLFARGGRGPAADQVPGSGLGLWIVRTVVAAHGGRVGVVRPDAPGGRVVVHLPLADAPAPDADDVHVDALPVDAGRGGEGGGR